MSILKERLSAVQLERVEFEPDEPPGLMFTMREVVQSAGELEIDLVNAITGKIIQPEEDDYTPRSHKDGQKCKRNKEWAHGEWLEDLNFWKKKAGELVPIHLVPAAERRKMVRIFRVYRYKRFKEPFDLRFKVRNVADGSKQKSGWTMTYSPVCKNTTIRLFFALAAYYGMEVYGSDLDQAFLQVNHKKPVYCYLPDNFKDQNGKLVDRKYFCLKVLKNLYGFDEAPKGLFDFMCEKLLKLGFIRSDHDPGLFYRMGKGEFTLCTVYVDDVNVGSTKKGAAAQVIADLEKLGVELSLERNPKRYVGYRIQYYKNGDISLDTYLFGGQLIKLD